MNFLKKFGIAVAKVVGVVSGFMPIAQAAFPSGTGQKVVSEINQVAGCIQTVESVFAAISSPDAKTGSDKLRAATPLVAQVIQQSELMANKKIKNEQAFIAACTTITGGFADLLNSLEG